MSATTDWARVAAERIFAHWGYNPHIGLEETAAIIRESYAAQPAPNVEERAREAAKDLYEEQQRGLPLMPLSEKYIAQILCEHFRDLEHLNARLRAAANNA